MSTNDPSRPDDTRPDDTLHDDVFADGAHDPDSTSRTQARETTALPVTPSAPGAGTTTATTSAPVATAAPGSTASEDEPWLRGPAPFAIVLGLLGLLVAGATLVTELTDVSFPWADLGPWTVVAAGLVVVLVGAIGLRSSRRTQD